MVPCGKCDTEKAAAYLYTYTYMNEKYMFVLNVAEGARTGYSRSLDIMIDPMHPEEYFSNMLFSADVGKKIGRSVIFLILAAFCAAIIYLGHSFERYSAEHFTAIHYDYLDS